MKFELRILNAGKVETVTVDASSAEEARRHAQDRQLEVLGARRIREPLQRKRFDLSLFAQEFAELLDAGLSVVEALDTLAQQQKDPTTAGTFAELVRSLKQGLTLSAALERMPQHFPPLFVGLLRAAEKTSDLHGALQRYIEYSARLDGLRSRVTSALIYPAILMVVGGSVVAFLMFFVVPRFAGVYRGAGRDLPLLSSWLLEWGSFAAAHAGTLILLALALFGSAAVWLIHAWRSGRLEQVVALVPGVQAKLLLFRLSRLYLTVGTLLNGGMPIVQALGLAQGVASAGLQTQLLATIDDLHRGSAISDSLDQHGLTTPVSSRLLRAGEGTGRIGDLLIRAGRYHDGELSRWVERFSRSFEPLLMTGIGIVIGGIVILLYMPIFDLAGSFR